MASSQTSKIASAYLSLLPANIDDVTMSWALARALGAAQMHAACTALVGLGISSLYEKRVLFFEGTFALLVMASIFHGIFNIMVQSEFKYLAFLWAALLFVPLIVVISRDNFRKKKKKPVKQAEGPQESA